MKENLNKFEQELIKLGWTYKKDKILCWTNKEYPNYELISWEPGGILFTPKFTHIDDSVPINNIEELINILNNERTNIINDIENALVKNYSSKGNNIYKFS